MLNWENWKRFSSARIGLGRSGGSVTTSDLLKFRLDHAKARDAVLVEPNFENLRSQAENLGSKFGIQTSFVSSLARDRKEFLLRPDLGRRLSSSSRDELKGISGKCDILICAVDGLSATALETNLIPFMQLLLESFDSKPWKLGPIVLARLGRVALGDEIGEVLNAKAVVVIIGERPGLSSSDSLGVYLTYGPKIGMTDELRNCISNIRPGGLELSQAVLKTNYLLSEAFAKKISGVALKDEMLPEFLLEKGPKTSERRELKKE
ncbi:ethanolamine ammonia-lyase [Leptospira perolatii]|uniref:Ethanolamine ammonia-lyase small subunit n=1 Tax=Leptospira perolatii TaxID=2023191 RepID=A0A2M9ZS99_9LEPT|nr:ethanolamine ammonia-lyase subunit EutC [Leptospira perolatii]PJZ71412.1 ethanolamine ammonia-lyase [Leptospira perolatii]PJZ74946.1 ethanolamine ammonia-lyase [Leptospira perolatii]